MDPDPDPGGPKTRGSGGSGFGFGSGSETLFFSVIKNKGSNPEHRCGSDYFNFLGEECNQQIKNGPSRVRIHSTASELWVVFYCFRAFDLIVSPYKKINNKPYIAEKAAYCVCARFCVNNERRRGGGGEDPVENRAVRELPERSAAGGPAAVPGAAGQHLHGAG